MSLQKTGLFHCLRTPSHLQLLKQASQLCTNIAPPDLTPSTSSSSVPIPIQTVPVTGTASSMSIRRKFLEGLVGSGAAPIQQQPPLPSVDTAGNAAIATPNVAVSPAMLTSPAATPIGGDGTPVPPGQYAISHLQQKHLRVLGGSSKESRDFNLTRVYQVCVQFFPSNTII